MLDILHRYSLQVFNFHPTCKGKWTRQIIKDGNLEKSVIDYIIGNDLVTPSVQSLSIDEDRFFTPYNIVKRQRVPKPIYTDHNSMLLELSWTSNEVAKPASLPSKDTHPGWKLNSEGLGQFQSCTSDDSQIPNMYSELEQYLNNVMDRCFPRRKSFPKTKEPKSYQEVRSKEIRKLVDKLKPMLRMGKAEKAVAKEYIALLQQEELLIVQSRRCSRIKETLTRMEDENGDFSVEQFWKLKKCVSIKREEKNSVLTRNGIEVFDVDAILNEYVVEFKERLSHRKIMKIWNPTRRPPINS